MNTKILLVKIKDDLYGEDLYKRTQGCWSGNIENASKVEYVFQFIKIKLKKYIKLKIGLNVIEMKIIKV